MISIWLFDDDPGRLSKGEAACIDLPSDVYKFSGKKITGADDLSSAITLLEADPNDKIVFLDLGFRRGTPVWDSTLLAIKSLAATTGLELREGMGGAYALVKTLSSNESVRPDDKREEIVPDEKLDGLSLISSLLRAECKGQKNLVILVSGQGVDSGLSEILEAIQSSAKRLGHNLQVGSDPEHRTFDRQERANKIVSDGIKKWEVSFPKFHKDDWTNNLVHKWVEGYRALKTNSLGDTFCHHNYIENEYAASYRLLVLEMFGLTAISERLPDDSNGAKALLQIQVPVRQITAESEWYHPWKQESAVPRWNMISSEWLKALLSSVGFKRLRINDQLREVRLPMTPAFPFFVSLHFLIKALESNNGENMINPDVDVRLDGYGSFGPFVLRIPLVEKPGCKFGVGYEWTTKSGLDGSQPNLVGVCGAIENTLRGKSEDYKDSSLTDEEKNLIQPLRGLKRPIVGVSFAPYWINIYWS